MIIILVCKIFSPFYDNLCFVSNSLALWPPISPTHQSNNINHLLLDQTITFSIETVWFVSWYHTKTTGICGVFIKCQYHWSWPALNPFYLNTIHLISDTSFDSLIFPCCCVDYFQLNMLQQQTIYAPCYSLKD